MLRLNPSVSVYETIEGAFDYNKIHLDPQGTKALMYEISTRQAVWAPHAVGSWYLGPAMDHYRCSLYFITETRATRISVTEKLFPTHCTLPSMSKQDKTILAEE